MGSAKDAALAIRAQMNRKESEILDFRCLDGRRHGGGKHDRCRVIRQENRYDRSDSEDQEKQSLR